MYSLFNELYGIATMAGNYEQRVVANDQGEDFIVDTARVTDRDWIFEIAIQHEKYNKNEWIIVGRADTYEDAIREHKKWLNFVKYELPKAQELTDIYTKRTYKPDLVQ